MELKQVSNIEQPEYVTKSKINSKTLKKTIPLKWLKTGITGFIFSIIMSGEKIFAHSFSGISIEAGKIEATPIEGPSKSFIPKYVSITAILSMVSILILLIACIRVAITKKDMPEDEWKKCKKLLIVLFVVSIVLLAPYAYYKITNLF